METTFRGRRIELRWDDDALVWVGRDVVTDVRSQGVTFNDCLLAVHEAYELKKRCVKDNMICWTCDRWAKMAPYEVGSGNKLTAICENCERAWTIWE